jgi:hypothetical protein
MRVIFKYVREINKQNSGSVGTPPLEQDSDAL